MTFNMKSEGLKTDGASPISPFVSVFKFNIVTAISFLHRASEVLLFIILGCSCLIYGVNSISEKYEWLQGINKILMVIASFLPVKLVALFGFWLLFFYSVTEIRFAMFDLKILKMTKNIAISSAIATAALSILFPALFVWIFLL